MQQSPQYQQPTDPNRSVRALEEKYSNLVRRAQLNEQNLLSSSKKANSELKAIAVEMAELRKEIEGLKEKFNDIVRELQTLAKKEDVDILKKYLNLWEPVNFVTQNEVEKIVKRVIEDSK